ncbi:MAG TPA: alcohol dehydrogenase catalytic domain-containing protein [Fimbriimonas sp.]|nr:alcohol dehydrogenase catalytic domain-containing protein [Fimbriimonas sp.]
MRALILQRPGCLTLEEIERPTAGPGELLVKVHGATTCGTDLKAFVRGHPQIPMPGPLGHEYSGVVEEAGPGANFVVGQAVMGVHSAPCQTCRWCLGGQENLCESIMATKVLGSYAEYLLIPERIARLNVFEKPESLSFEQASLLEPLACVAQGIIELQKTKALPAENALVVGPGAIGLLFVAALQKSGVGQVKLAGRNASRLEAGVALGAEAAKWPDVLTRPEIGFDLVIECTGQVKVWEKSVGFVRRGGHVMLFGGPPKGSRASFDTNRLHYDQITLLSPFHFGTAAVKQAYEWLTDGKLDLSPLISGARSLEQGEQTFAELLKGQGIKYVFKP